MTENAVVHVNGEDITQMIDMEAQQDDSNHPRRLHKMAKTPVTLKVYLIYFYLI